MAIKDDDLDLETDDEGSEKTKSGSKKIILIGVGVVLLLAIAIGATLFFTGAFSSDEAMEASAEGEKTEEVKEKSKPADDEPVDKSIVFYHAFDPAFVVNFEDKGSVHYLQLGLSVMMHKESVIGELQKHDPVLRNNLVLLLSSQDYKTLSTREGKETLRMKVRSEIQKVLKKYAGTKGIEEAFFTSFVIQ